MPLPPNLLTDDEINEHYTHKAVMFMFVPVYAGGDLSDYGMPHICTRNWVPEFVLDIAEMLFFTCVRFGILREDHVLYLTGKTE